MNQPRPYKQFNRKCNTCGSQLYQRAVGTGVLKGRILVIVEIFCQHNCLHIFSLTKQEIKIQKAITGVKYVN